MFFKAAWRVKFDTALTTAGPFQLSGGGVVSAHYMQMTRVMQVRVARGVCAARGFAGSPPVLH